MEDIQKKYNALIKKYNMLLAENEKLKSILQEHDIDYSYMKIPDEVSEFTSIMFHPVNFSLDEKVALFRSLFKGREDVFERRWFSKTTEKCGYQPACINEWRKGICDKNNTSAHHVRTGTLLL